MSELRALLCSRLLIQWANDVNGHLAAGFPLIPENIQASQFPFVKWVGLKFKIILNKPTLSKQSTDYRPTVDRYIDRYVDRYIDRYLGRHYPQ